MDPEEPQKPGTVTVKVAANNLSAVKLTWTKGKDAQGYTVYRKMQGESKYTRAGVVNGGNTCSYTVKGLKPGKVYTFVVKAWIKDGSYHFGDASKAVRGVTKPTYVAIKRLTVNGAGDVKVQLAGASKGATKYAMCYSKRADFKDFQVGIRTSSIIRTMAKGLAPGTYYVKVRPYRMDGNTKVYGSWSVAKKVVVK